MTLLSRLRLAWDRALVRMFDKRMQIRTRIPPKKSRWFDNDYRKYPQG